VHLIPETRDVTTFGMVQVGDRINVEVDAQTQAVVETVRRLLADPQMSALLSR
jgi:riboflavin synthase